VTCAEKKNGKICMSGRVDAANLLVTQRGVVFEKAEEHKVFPRSKVGRGFNRKKKGEVTCRRTLANTQATEKYNKRKKGCLSARRGKH